MNTYVSRIKVKRQSKWLRQILSSFQVLIEWSCLPQIGGSKTSTDPWHVWGPPLSDKTDKELCFTKMGLTVNASLLFLAFFVVSGVKITPQGGYTDLVIKIQDEVPEDHCPEILENLKVCCDFCWTIDVSKMIRLNRHVFIRLVCCCGGVSNNIT